PRLRGRQQDGLVRGQLPDLRGSEAATVGGRSRPASPHPLQEAAPVGGTWPMEGEQAQGLHPLGKRPRGCNPWAWARKEQEGRSFALAMMELVDVTKVFQQGRRSVQAVRGVSLKIESGEFVSIMGPSGSG